MGHLYIEVCVECVIPHYSESFRKHTSAGNHGGEMCLGSNYLKEYECEMMDPERMLNGLGSAWDVRGHSCWELYEEVSL